MKRCMRRPTLISQPCMKNAYQSTKSNNTEQNITVHYIQDHLHGQQYEDQSLGLCQGRLGHHFQIIHDHEMCLRHRN